MKKLKTMLFVLLASMATTPILAGSADFAGPYIAVTGAINGIIADGNAQNSNNEVTEGTLGKILPSVGGEAGYGIPIGDNFVLGIGAGYLPGDARIFGDAGGSSGVVLTSGSLTEDGSTDVNVKFDEYMIGYIQPTISVSDNSAFYAKVGVAHVGLALSGDVKDGKGGLQGDLYGLGTKTMFGSGLYLQTEAGVVAFDEIQFERLSATGSAVADIDMAYGSMSIGYKF